jgi:hypothetical protein
MGSYRKKKRRGRTNLAELGAQWRLREHSTLSMGYRVLLSSYITRYMFVDCFMVLITPYTVHLYSCPFKVVVQ